MINKISNITHLAFKARFINDRKGNYKFLLNRSGNYIDKKESDTFENLLPAHEIEILDINIDKSYHINGVNLLNHNSGETKYIDTKSVPNTVILNNIIKKLNSNYKESQIFHGDDDHEKIYGHQRGFFEYNPYF